MAAGDVTPLVGLSPTLAILRSAVELLGELAPADGDDPSEVFALLAAGVEKIAEAFAAECGCRRRRRRRGRRPRCYR